MIQLLMIGGILFFVIELKLGCLAQDNIAQLFLELLCKLEFLFLSYAERIQRLHVFHFYSYDQSERKFAFDETLQAGGARETSMADMIHVTKVGSAM